MMKKILISFVAVLSLCSCLKLQTGEEYTGKALDRNVGMNCWEFMQSRPDLFSSMIDGVNLCGLQDCYTQNTQAYTYLLLTNKAVASKVNSALADPTEDALAELKAIFLFHIIRGAYDCYTNLDYNVIYVDTLLSDEDAQMSLCVTDHPSNKSNYGRLAVMTDCGSSTICYSVASNYLATNGPVHIFDTICTYKD